MVIEVKRLMVIEVKRLPLNAQWLFYRLFPTRKLVYKPAELLFKPVLIDTRFEYLAHFGKFAEILNDRKIPSLVVTELPNDGSDLSVTTPFKSIVFFDLNLLPSQYRLLKKAARRAIMTLPLEEISYLPKFLTMGYTEMRVDDHSIEDARSVLEQENDCFCFCQAIAKRAKELRQFKIMVSSPPYLESRIQKLSPRFVLLRQSASDTVKWVSDTVKCVSIYWLNEEEFKTVIQDREA